MRSENGRVEPVTVEILPNGSVLTASIDTRRETMTSGDYRLAERQKGRSMKDIDRDFLKVPPFNRVVATRNRRSIQ